MVKYIIHLLFVVFIGYVSYDYGFKKAHNKQLEITIEQFHDQEVRYGKLQDELTLIKTQKENEIKAINSKHAAIVSSLRNRPERITIKETNNCSAICARTGSTGEQLFREDAEFLIGQARLAEVLKQSLISCRKEYESLLKE